MEVLTSTKIIIEVVKVELSTEWYPSPTSGKQDLESWAFCTHNLGHATRYRSYSDIAGYGNVDYLV